MKRNIAVIAALAVGLTIGGLGTAFSSSSGTTVCVNKKTGVMRWPTSGCSSTERKVLIAMQGPQGDLGPQGPEGAQGATGPQGLKGDSGVTGPQGLKGDTGNQGAVGAQGPKGDVGPSGSGFDVVDAQGTALGAFAGTENSSVFSVWRNGIVVRFWIKTGMPVDVDSGYYWSTSDCDDAGGYYSSGVNGLIGQTNPHVHQTIDPITHMKTDTFTVWAETSEVGSRTASWYVQDTNLFAADEYSCIQIINPFKDMWERPIYPHRMVQLPNSDWVRKYVGPLSLR